MHTLLLIVGFVIGVNGEAKFFVSRQAYASIEKCDADAAQWADDMHNQPGVSEVYSQCAEMPGTSS